MSIQANTTTSWDAALRFDLKLKFPTKLRLRARTGADPSKLQSTSTSKVKNRKEQNHLRLLSNAQAGSTIKRQLILLLTWIRSATLRTPTKESKTWKGRNMPTRTWKFSSKTNHLVKLYVSTVLSILISWPTARPNSSLTRVYPLKNQHCLARSRGEIQLTSGTTRHSVAMAEVQNTTTLKSAKKTR